MLSGFRGNRQLAVVFGLILLAVPTFAVLFPGLIHRTDRPVRIVVMLLWLFVAFLTAYVAQPPQPQPGAHPDSLRRGGDGTDE